MPFNDDNGNPWIPRVGVSTFGVTAEELQQVLEVEPLEEEEAKPRRRSNTNRMGGTGEKSDGSGWDEFKTGFAHQNTALNVAGWIDEQSYNYDEQTSVEQAFKRYRTKDERQSLSEQFENFDWQQFVRPEDEDFMDYYQRVANENDVAIVHRRIDEFLAKRKVVEEGGAAMIAGQLAGAVLSPENYVPIIGQASIAAKGKLGLALGKRFGSAVATDGIHELINYGTNRNYTTEEVGYGLAGSLILNAAFGAYSWKAAKKWADAQPNPEEARELLVQEAVEMGKDFDPAIHRSAGAAAVTEEDIELVNQGFIRKISSFSEMAGGRSGSGKIKSLTMPPNLIGATSHSKTVRKINFGLLDNSFYTTANKSGRALPPNAQLRIATGSDSVILKAEQDFDAIYKRYTTDTDAPLNKQEFSEEVSRSLRSGITGDNAYANEAARAYRSLQNDLYDRAAKAGIIDEGLDNSHYLSRIWDRTAIEANEGAFRQTVYRWLQQNADVSRLDDPVDIEDYLQDQVTKIVNNILSGDIVKGNSFDIAGRSGTDPLKKRVFGIADNEVEDFIESDVRKIHERYSRQMVQRIEQERFLKENGWKSKEDMAGAIKDEYEELIQAATTQKAKKALREERQDAIKYATDIFDKTFGMRSRGGVGALDNIARGVGRVMTLSKLGGVAASSVPDVGRVVMELGLAGLGRGIKAAAQGVVKDMKVAELERLGILTERAMNLRMNQLYGIDEGSTTTLIGEGIDKLYRKFGTLTGMNWWNHNLKYVAITGAETSFMKQIDNFNKGKRVSKKMRTEMARWGIGEDMYERIGKQFAEHGQTKKGVHITNAENWTDPVAREVYVNAMRKLSMNVINTPSEATLPGIFDSAAGKLFMQFKSFLFASHAQTFIPMMQSMDANRFAGLMTMTALGGMVYAGYEKLRELRDPSYTGEYEPTKIIVEGIDRSGAAAFLFDWNNMAEKVSSNQIGLRAALDLEQGQRWRNVSPMGAVLGPTFGAGNDTLRAGMYVFDGKYDKAIDKAWRQLPYQNLIWTRHWTDQMKDALGDWTME